MDTSLVEDPRKRPEFWRVSSLSDIVLTEWEDDYVVFHRPSGKTHLLNSASVELLTRILLDWQDTEQIVAEFVTGVDRQADDEVANGIEDLLLYLDELGLVTRQ